MDGVYIEKQKLPTLKMDNKEFREVSLRLFPCCLCFSCIALTPGRVVSPACSGCVLDAPIVCLP